MASGWNKSPCIQGVGTLKCALAFAPSGSGSVALLRARGPVRTAQSAWSYSKSTHAHTACKSPLLAALKVVLARSTELSSADTSETRSKELNLHDAKDMRHNYAWLTDSKDAQIAKQGNQLLACADYTKTGRCGHRRKLLLHARSKNEGSWRAGLCKLVRRVSAGTRTCEARSSVSASTARAKSAAPLQGRARATRKLRRRRRTRVWASGVAARARGTRRASQTRARHAAAAACSRGSNGAPAPDGADGQALPSAHQPTNRELCGSSVVGLKDTQYCKGKCRGMRQIEGRYEHERGKAESSNAVKIALRWQEVGRTVSQKN
eukprot:6192080-Pleurochrysis_carterae.AAC.1